MLDIKVHNESLDLFPGTKIKFVYKNPLFSKQSIDVVFSYPVKLPLTRKNQWLLGFAHILENDAVFPPNPDCLVFESNELLIKGTLRIKKNFKTSLLTNIVAAEKDLAERFKTKKLSELLLGGIRDYTYPGGDADLHTDMLNRARNIGSPPKDWLNPMIYNPRCFSDKEAAPAYYFGFVNYYKPHTFQHVFGSETKVPITFMPYLKYVVEQIFMEFNLELEGDILQDPAIAELILFSTEIIFMDINEWGILLNLADFLPDLLISDLFNGLKDLLGLGVFFDFKLKRVRLIPFKQIINGNSFLNWSDKAHGLHGQEIKEPKGFKLKFHHDPEDRFFQLKPAMRFTDFAGGFDSYEDLTNNIPYPPDNGDYFLTFSHNEIWIYDGPVAPLWISGGTKNPSHIVKQLPEKFVYRGEVDTVGGASTHLGALQNVEAGHIALVLDVNEFWVADKDPGSGIVNWSRYGYNLVDRVIGKGIQIIESKFSPTMNWSVKLPDGQGRQNMAAIDQAGSNKNGFYGLSKANNNLRLMFARYAGTIPTLLHTSTGGEYSLDYWTSSNSLYNVWLRQWLDFLDHADTVIFDMNLNAKDLSNLDLSKKIEIRGNKYLIKELTVTLPIKEPAKVDLLKINSPGEIDPPPHFKSLGDEITIYIEVDTGGYIDIDWGDGTSDTGLGTGLYNHSFVTPFHNTASLKEIRFSGSLDKITYISSNGWDITNANFQGLLNCQTYDLEQSPFLEEVIFPSTSIAIQKVWLQNCGLKGTLDLAPLAQLGGDLRIYGNPLLTHLTMPQSSNTLNYFEFHSCDLQGHLDLSGLTGLEGNFYGYWNGNLSSLTLPASGGSFVNFRMHGCNLQEGVILKPFHTALSLVELQDNNMSQGAVDSIIHHLYFNRNNFTDNSPTLDIGGTNQDPSGIYQSPAACPAVSALERVYEMENDSCGDGHKKWSITY